VVNVLNYSELVDTAADGTQAPRVLMPRVLITGIIGSGRPVWSPSGDRIAFTGETGPLDGIPEQISVVDVGSQVVTPLASAPPTGYLQGIGFSPQGDRILYGTFDTNGLGISLWSVSTDGSNAQLLVTGTAWGEWQR
jgi:Tol biopolymer transport system component